MSHAPLDPPYLEPLLRTDLLEQGWNDKAIARRVRSGAWTRLRRGAYVDSSTWVGLGRARRHELLCRAVVAQAGVETTLSHLSALVVHDLDLWDVELGEVHLTRGDQRAGRSEAGVRQHRGVLLEGERVSRRGLHVVSGTRLAVEVTTLLDVEHSLVVVDQLLRRGLTTPDELAARAASAATWPGSLCTDLVVRLADGRHESVGETRLAHVFRTQHLPRPVPQHEVRDGSGRLVARLDLALPEHGCFAEFDGRVKYADLLAPGESVEQVVMREKRREQLVCDLTGWRCVRVTWADLARPEALAARIRRAMAAPRAA